MVRAGEVTDADTVVVAGAAIDERRRVQPRRGEQEIEALEFRSSDEIRPAFMSLLPFLFPFFHSE